MLSPARTGAATTWRLLLPAAVLLAVIGLRVWYDVYAPPMGDEAYYWIWGQRPNWSYFDHPPLDAWLQAGVAAIFGWSPLSLRLLTWISFAGVFAVLFAWGRAVVPAAPLAFTLRTGAALLTVPVVALFSVPAFHDHLLIAFSVAALYFFWRFATGWEEGGRRGVRFLYAAAVAMGLATLSKYNGALLGIGFAAAFVVRPGLRPALRTPHPYLAALLAVALQAPVIYWNMTEGFATLTFHLLERPSGHWGRPELRQVAGFALQALIAAGPVLLLALPFARRGANTDRERRAISLGSIALVSATIVVAIVASFTDILAHWNIVSYVALGLTGYWALRNNWLFVLHAALGLYLLTGAITTYTTGTSPLPGFIDPGTEANFGWDEVGREMTALRAAHPEAFVAATKYNYAAQLSFALHSTDVTAINPLRSQYDLWWDGAAHRGQEALIVADARNPIALSSGHFARVTKLADVPARVSGRPIWTYSIYLGEDYAP